MGKPPNLYAFQSAAELAPSLRTYVLDAQNAALERHQVFRVAVSGGSLPKTLAQALLKETNGEGKVQFDKWEIFYADERAVPLDHEDSNHRLVKEELLDKIPSELGTPKVYPIDVKYLDDVQELADQYEKTLVSVFAARDSVKLPLFDLLLLGFPALISCANPRRGYFPSPTLPSHPRSALPSPFLSRNTDLRLALLQLAGERRTSCVKFSIPTRVNNYHAVW